MTEPNSKAQRFPMSPPQVQRFFLPPHDKIILGTTAFKVQESNISGHLLRHVEAPDLCSFFTHAEIDTYRRAGKLKLCKGAFLASQPKLLQVGAEGKLTDLPPQKLAKVLFRKLICDGILRMQDSGITSRTDISLKPAIETIHAEFARIEKARQTKDGRCGTKTETLNPPSPTTVRKWLRRYEACGFEPMALCDGYHRSGRRQPRLESQVRALMREFAEKYKDRRKPTMASLYLDLVDEIKRRHVDDMMPLVKPSRAAFERVVNELDPYHVYAAREGTEAARKKFHIVQRGLDVTRPLERVEMDEWNIPLQTILEDAKVWSTLSADQKKYVGRQRLWLSTAIDTVTRCVLAARVVTAPSAASAIATLEMAVNDKTAYAEAAGCKCPWDMIGKFETIAMDNGPSFIAHETRAAITDLGSEAIFPPAGRPQMRGRQERLYRTTHEQLVSFFDGRSFENVVAKGDYDSEAMAIITGEEISKFLVRYYVDIYHNSPHGGLAGETPRNAWIRLTELFPVIPPPDPDENRHIFGNTIERRVGNGGIRVLGLRFQSLELQRARTGQKPVLVRMDPNDLGYVSVRVREGWLTVPGMQPGLEGCSVNEWIATAKALRRKNADMAKLSESIVSQARLEIREFSDMATKRAGISSPILSAEDFDRLDRDLFRTFDFSRDDEGEAIDILDRDEYAGEDLSSTDDSGVIESSRTDDPDDGDWFMED